MKEAMTKALATEARFTHARYRGEHGTLCGLSETEAKHRVVVDEFMRLKTPPAPWCPNCAEAAVKSFIGVIDKVTEAFVTLAQDIERSLTAFAPFVAAALEAIEKDKQERGVQSEPYILKPPIP